MQNKFKKYKRGNSGVYSRQYHELLGTTPWIRVKHLLIPSPHTPDSTNGVLGPQLSEGDVVTAFSQFGEIDDIRFVRHSRTGRFLGTAFVKFVRYEDAIMAADCMNSDEENGERFYLNAPVKGQRAIEVDRCEACSVPAPYSDAVQTYPQWLRRKQIQLGQ